MSFQRNEMEITIKRYDKIYIHLTYAHNSLLQDVLPIFEFAKTSIFHQNALQSPRVFKLASKSWTKQVQLCGVSYSSISAWAVTQMVHHSLPPEEAKPKKLQRQGHTGTCAKSFFCDLNGDLMTWWPESSLTHVWHATKHLGSCGFREEPKHVFWRSSLLMSFPSTNIQHPSPSKFENFSCLFAPLCSLRLLWHVECLPPEKSAVLVRNSA